MAIRTLLLAALISVGLSSITQAQVYRWTDADGKVHYSDQAPKHAASQHQNIDAPPVGNGSGPDYGIELDKPKPRAIPDKLHALPTPDPALCQRARTSLEVLSAGGRIRGKAENGGVTYLTPDEIAEQISRSEQTIAVHCVE